MTKIIGVRFKPVGKMYYFDPLDFEIKRGDNVIVETSRGIEYGEVTLGIKEVDESSVVKPLKGVLRLANEEDTQRYKANKEKEKEAYKICVEKIAAHKLDMKLIEVEYTFDGNKLLFYFTADGRVDFRELVKDLAAIFRTRIELRQIGVRDESKTLGSIGVCGRNLCCSQFLGEFVPVSIKMAKEQGLSLNPSKISGACGRLMCCLKYEQDTYEQLIKSSPRAGASVMTPEGKGTVVNVALLKGRVRVRLGEGDESTQKDFSVDEISEAGSKASEQEAEEDIIADEELSLLESLENAEAEPDKKRHDKPKPHRQKKQNPVREDPKNVQQDGEKRNSEKIGGRKPFKGKNAHKRHYPRKQQEEK